MHGQPERPFRESDLKDPAYRLRLLRKLNCLFAVLEVANARVERAIAQPDSDLERLGRIKTNLGSTMDVCRRAKSALERQESLPEGLPENLAASARGPGPRLPEGARVEMRSRAEFECFSAMGPIGRDEIDGCDMDRLIQRLQP
jgi:hypothetical protein